MKLQTPTSQPATDYVTVYNSRAFWSRSKSKTGRSYSLQEIKSYFEFLINNSLIQVVFKIFRQVKGILMWSDPAPFFDNLFLFFYESRWLKSIKNMGLLENLAVFLGLLMI